MTTENCWLTPEDLAQELQLTTNGIMRLVAEGRLPAAAIDGQIRLRRHDVDRYLQNATLRRPWPRQVIWATLAIGVGAIGASVTTYIHAQSASASRSQTIPYQGYLEANGQVAEGTRELTFCLSQSSDAAAACVWQETQVAQVVAGRFSVNLGAVTDLGAALNGISSLWLGISVRDVDPTTGQGTGTAIALAGKQAFGSVPYARRGAPGAGFTVDGDLSVGSNISAAGRMQDRTGYVTPVGVIASYAGATVPKGWLLCDGTAVSSSTYPELYQSIGNSWGDGGDGTGPLFNLPDLRGQFLRGADLGVQRDPDRVARPASGPNGNVGDAVGSRQDAALARHTHQVHGTSSWMCYGDACRGLDLPVHREDEPLGFATTETGGSETRPMNIYVTYIVKY